MNYLCWGLSIAKFKTQNRFLFTIWHTSAQALSSLVGLYTRHELNFHYDLTPSEIIGASSLLCPPVSTWVLRLSLSFSWEDRRFTWCVYLREGTEDTCLAQSTSLKRHVCPQSHDLGWVCSHLCREQPAQGQVSGISSLHSQLGVKLPDLGWVFRSPVTPHLNHIFQFLTMCEQPS